MTDNTGLNDAAVSWLRGLAARGVTVGLRNGRIALAPASAYKQLTDDELIFLRHHRDEIKHALRAGFSVQAKVEPCEARSAPTSTPAPEPPPPTCSFCYQTPCIGAAHPAFRALHTLDPAEIKRQNDEATRDMWHALLGVFTDFSWPSDPPDTPEEARSRELRRKLGWESSYRTVDERGFLK